MSTVAETVALAIHVTEGKHDGIRRYELRSRLSGHTVAQLRDALTAEQLSTARLDHGRPLRKEELIAVVIQSAGVATTPGIREEQTTGYGPGASNDNHPLTEVYDGSKLLGTLRNDGFFAFDGEFVNNWVAFAGGASVPMPAGFPTSRDSAKRALLNYVRTI